MKRLTLMDPWAGAILDLGKRVENRPVRANYTGPVAIHVGLDDDMLAPAPAVRNMLDVAPPRGHIIGVVDIVSEHSIDDCTMTGPCAVDHNGFSWAMFVSRRPGRPLHHWILGTVRELDEPIAIRGVQGMVDLPREIENRIYADLAVKQPRGQRSVLR